MPYTPLQIANLGLGKIAASFISRLDPPKSQLEKHVAAGYQSWKRTEIAKRRWVFAMQDGVQLTQTAIITAYETAKKYEYQLPDWCLRPIRERETEWKQRGRKLYSAYETLFVSMMVNKEEDEFDELFVDAFACRIVKESTEYITQSNTKLSNIDVFYKDAIEIASLANAFVRGDEGHGDNDESFPYLTARW